MNHAQKFALVAVPAPLKEPLIYSIPENIKNRIAAGARVLIPLQKRKITGIVLDIVSENHLDAIKPIAALLDEEPYFDAHLLKLAKWISQYYLTSLGEVIATMLPPYSRRQQSQKFVKLKCVEAVSADALEQRVIHELTRRKGEMSLKALARKFPGQTFDADLLRLESRGIIQIEEHPPAQRRRKAEPSNAVSEQANSAPPVFDLTAEQDCALRAIEQRIGAGGFETFLLHGVTGSGKTEVYLRAMEQARDLGRKSVVLIPEISLTPQLLHRVNARFPNRVGVLHSALTATERWAQWREIARGAVDVVVGARSAIFAPIPNLGLIVVDEEHDPSYKQEDGVRYNGRDVAVMRGKLLDCAVILGSATPALESYENCRQGRYRLLEITRRVEQRPLPTIEAIDLRRQFQAAKSDPSGTEGTAKSPGNDRQLISDTLANAVKANFAAGRQTLIFLNRRGFANFLQCTACGYVWRCPYCSVTLTWHLKLNKISCHHCDYRRPTTEVCPGCNNPTLAGVGTGTERIEQALKQLVPQARLARMDRDTTTRRGSHADLIRRWERGEIDILVGTQMITKGHDVSGVTLVGALLADLSLNLPDFRAAERTFQLLTQVAGRSGRGDISGRVIVQTYAPDHYAIQYLTAHDYRGFFAAESEFRRALNYPPFSRLVNLRVDGPKLANVEKRAQALASQLREVQSTSSKFRHHIEVLGPAAAPIEKLRNRYRWQILLRSKQTSTLLAFARRAPELFRASRAVRLHIDVDPYSML